MRKILALLFLLVPLFYSAPASAQAVLFDGLTNGEGDVTALLAPAVITGDDYGLFARFDWGLRDRINLFGLGGARFNGGSHGLGGAGFSANLVQQGSFPLNVGFFNSYIFQTGAGGPDAFITLAPVFSRSFDRSTGGRVTPYGGFAATILAGPGGTDVNGVLGVKVTDIGSKWDFIAELQPGERNQFALGFVFKF